jgi:hypothetical protein
MAKAFRDEGGSENSEAAAAQAPTHAAQAPPHDGMPGAGQVFGAAGGVGSAAALEEHSQLWAPRQAATPATRLQGAVDEVRPSGITGWVWDPRQPQQRISLDLMDGETRL